MLAACTGYLGSVVVFTRQRAQHNRQGREWMRGRYRIDRVGEGADRECTLDCVFTVFFFQAEDGIRDLTVTGVQTCALPIYSVAGFLNSIRGATGGSVCLGSRSSTLAAGQPS